MTQTTVPSRLKLWLGVAAAVTVLLVAVNVRSDDDERDHTAIFDADFTPDKRNSATWIVDWGVRGQIKREQEPDAPFKRTLKVKAGDRLWIQVLRSNPSDPRMRCVIILDGKRIPGRIHDQGAGCEASGTVPA